MYYFIINTRLAKDQPYGNGNFVDKLPYTVKNDLDMSRINDIKENEDIKRLFEMLFDEFGSGSIRTLRVLFDALSMCGVGYNGQMDRSGQIGVLDSKNMAMIQRILNNGDILNILVRAWFYRIDINNASNLDIASLMEEKVQYDED